MALSGTAAEHDGQTVAIPDVEILVVRNTVFIYSPTFMVQEVRSLMG